MKIIQYQSYSIYIGDECLQEISNLNYSKVAVLVDENTKEYCLELFLENSKIKVDLIVCISSGEENKNIHSCQQIWKELSTNQFDRKSLLINLGGGVIGDLGGFAGSCYKRGIDFIQVPTTLLAMVDASIGGKLGVDFMGLKNQIGIFKNPQNIYIYPKFLKTLDKRQLKSGFAEVIKHALIADKSQWESLRNTDFENLKWEDIIKHSVNLKHNIVTKDPLENGERKILNFGHTLGHAIESHYLAQGKAVLHGDAIALGMYLECQLSSIEEEEKKEIKSFLNTTFKLINSPSLDELVPFIENDKKNENGKIHFSLLSKIGSCAFNCSPNMEELKAIFQSYS